MKLSIVFFTICLLLLTSSSFLFALAQDSSTVLTFSAPPGSVYIGTFRDHPFRALNDGPKQYTYSVATCQAACSAFRYFALQDMGWCSCSDDITSVIQYGVDNTPAGSAHPLGLAWMNAVYANIREGDKSVMAGFFIDMPERALRYGPQSGVYTPDSCCSTCRSRGFRLSGLQNTNWCTCDNDLLHAQMYGVAWRDGIGKDCTQLGKFDVFSLRIDVADLAATSAVVRSATTQNPAGAARSSSSSSSAASSEDLSTGVVVGISVVSTIVAIVLLQTIVYYSCFNSNKDNNNNRSDAHNFHMSLQQQQQQQQRVRVYPTNATPTHQYWPSPEGHQFFTGTAGNDDYQQLSNQQLMSIVLGNPVQPTASFNGNSVPV